MFSHDKVDCNGHSLLGETYDSQQCIAIAFVYYSPFPNSSLTVPSRYVKFARGWRCREVSHESSESAVDVGNFQHARTVFAIAAPILLPLLHHLTIEDMILVTKNKRQISASVTDASFPTESGFLMMVQQQNVPATCRATAQNVLASSSA